MRWNNDHDSPDVIDQRGQTSLGRGGGILALVPLLIRSPLGLTGTVLLVGGYYAFNWFTGGAAQQAMSGKSQQTDPQKMEAKAFVSFVLDDVQNTWEQRFSAAGERYPRAKLVLFTGSTNTACGYGEAASGPFYCPADRRAYIDLQFYQELASRFGAPGDFAQAYVIAHEIGHHVQNILGTSTKVHEASKAEQAGATGLSVRLELQADCYAGLWAHSTQQRQILEAGDIEEGLTAAAAIGDDQLQRQAGRTVRPESFTHGSSQQRVKWFRRGYETGQVKSCDTFSGPL